MKSRTADGRETPAGVTETTASEAAMAEASAAEPAAVKASAAKSTTTKTTAVAATAAATARPRTWRGKRKALRLPSMPMPTCVTWCSLHHSTHPKTLVGAVARGDDAAGRIVRSRCKIGK